MHAIFKILCVWVGFLQMSALAAEPIDHLFSLEGGDPRFKLSRIHANRIFKKYSPEYFAVLGLGRTTGLVSERLRQLSGKEDYVFEVPVERLSEVIQLTREGRDTFYRKILPSPEVLGHRRLVLHRVLWHGMTLSVVTSDLIRFMKENGYRMPLHAYLVTNLPASSLLMFQFPEEKLYLKDMETQVIVDSIFQQAYQNELDHNSQYKGLTRVGKYVPADLDEILQPNFTFKINPNYIKLISVVQRDQNKIRRPTSSCVDLFASQADL